MKPYKLTLTEAARQINEGKMAPVRLTESLLERIEDTEINIHAWVTIDPEKAIKKAEKTGNKKPLTKIHGIPIGIKDIYYTAGIRTTIGSPIYKDFIPDMDAEIVRKLKKSGATILGKTETTEFALHDPAPTTNPWNTRHTPGGSSSGSAAAVATGMCPAAFGSQTGGSVIRPASYCGIIGVKPTYDLLSREGVYPLSWSLDHVGYMTRTVEDAHHLLSAITGKEKAWSQLETPPKIGVLKGYFQDNAEPMVWEKYSDTVEKLWGMGANMVDVTLPRSFRDIPNVHRVIMSVETAAVHEDQFSEKKEKYGEYIQGFISSGLLVPATAYLRAQRLRTKIIKELLHELEKYDCFICPSTVDPAPEGLEWTGSPAFNVPWSLTGLPSITVPMGLTDDKLPLGLQMVGAPYREWSLLRIAGWCEKRLDFPETPIDPV
ncbi:MAG: amidase [archaeon]